MKAQEKQKVIELIATKAKKRGLPLNVRTGGNDDLAEWLKDLMEELMPVDEPMGIVEMKDYTACPECGGAIGQSAYYCKHCGAYLRQKLGRSI